MHAHDRITKLGMLALAGGLALGMAACEDDPTGVEEHAEPAFVRLTLGGVEIAQAAHQNVGTSTGQIDVLVGAETDHITVQYLDVDGDVIVLDDDFYLEVDVENETTAAFEQDTPGEFGGHAHGEAEGQTTMTFKLMHGAIGSGHPDFTPAPIEVHVSAATSP